MAIKHSLLAILAEDDCYGYQLKQEIELRTGDSLSINVGQIYTTLERLQRDKLVTRVESEQRGQRRYRITEAGREETRRWFSRAVLEDPQNNRSEVAVKVALAMTLPGVNPQEVIDTQRRAISLQLHELKQRAHIPELPEDYETLIKQITLDDLISRNIAQLEWLERAERSLRHLQQHQEPSFPVRKQHAQPGRPRITNTGTQSEEAPGAEPLSADQLSTKPPSPKRPALENSATQTSPSKAPTTTTTQHSSTGDQR